MTRKREVRDARFPDREPKSPKNPSQRPSRPVDVDDDDDAPQAPEAPSAPRAWYQSPNVIIPGVLAVFLGWAVFEKFRPAPRPDAPAESAADAGSPAAPEADAAARVEAAPAPAPAPAAAPTPTPLVDAGVALDPNPVEAVHGEPTSPDPLAGRFTLAQATEGLAGDAPLHADIVTSMGTFDCELLSQQAPNTVANFVGLARAKRDFWDPVAGRWTRRPFYNGSLFHRVIPEFMIQGGDILRSGQGDPGYEIADENVRPHDAPGLLCMANHGPNTGGAQFFITEMAKEHLDGTYSIFGRCTPTDLVGRITRLPRSASDRPNEPVYILRVDVRRGPRAAQ